MLISPAEQQTEICIHSKKHNFSQHWEHRPEDQLHVVFLCVALTSYFLTCAGSSKTTRHTVRIVEILIIVMCCGLNLKTNCACVIYHGRNFVFFSVICIVLHNIPAYRVGTENSHNAHLKNNSANSDQLLLVPVYTAHYEKAVNKSHSFINQHYPVPWVVLHSHM
jgi:hypothetical protein